MLVIIGHGVEATMNYMVTSKALFENAFQSFSLDYNHFKTRL